MKGDFTRWTFNKKKHYRKVKMQQGRVQVDADWNEQVDIDFHYERASLTDIIGATGTLIGNDGFEIVWNPTQALPTDYLIKKGHYYVDGILCENDGMPKDGSDVKASQQVDLPSWEMDGQDYSAIPKPGIFGVYSVYLDVWERHITSLDNPMIRDVALMGTDTATRAKIVWQVKVLRHIGEDQINCLSPLETAQSNGLLRARARPTQPSQDPCVLAPEAGYRGLGNQLYRVEISDPGVLSSSPNASQKPPTFKWSRDNGIVVSKILAIDETNNKLTVNSTGRDDNLGFATAIAAEVTDDRHELWGIPGTFIQITKVVQNTITFDPVVNGDQVTNANFPQVFNPKVRRWDVGTDLSTVPGLQTVSVPATNFGYIELEKGVEVKFEPGKNYATGDYWLIRASTATADVEWINAEYQIQWSQVTVSGSSDEANLKAFLVESFRSDYKDVTEWKTDPNDSNNITATSDSVHLSIRLNNDYTAATLTIDNNFVYAFPVSQTNGMLILEGKTPRAIPPVGIQHHFARLAILTYTKYGITVVDCRNFFAPATDLTHLYYVGGDGQEASPGGSLPAPLRAGVSLGNTPLKGRLVRFTIKDGKGSLSGQSTGGGSSTVDLPTNDEGIAICFWTLDSSNQPQTVQTVKAFLLDAGGSPTSPPPLYYTANPETSQAAIANTGLIRLFDYDKGGIYGPFKHFFTGDVPPCIILGYAGTQFNLGYAYTEDWGLYQNFLPVDKELWTVQFKPVKVTNDTFYVQFFDPAIPTSLEPYFIRWWAIPAKHQTNYDQTNSRAQP